MNPTTSFVVPCYKLAHLLPHCLDSILGQSNRDLEVLLMDDCSPDDTPAVAAKYQGDPRVRYIRHPNNVGHLRNYNAGIQMARGKFVWLISADDYVRVPHALDRYVDLLEKHPNVGYAFCPAVRATNKGEGELLEYSRHGNRDRIFNGPKLVKELILANTIVAASGIVRRDCYENISLFPLDMPWAGDWYLWCLFALHYNVGYISEPLVAYRTHELSMTNILMHGGLDGCAAEDVAMPWVIRDHAVATNRLSVVPSCLKAAALEYARSCTSQRYRTSTSKMKLGQFESSLCQKTQLESERRWIRARVLSTVADHHYWEGDLEQAHQFYRESLRNDPFLTVTQAKLFLLRLGRIGSGLRGGLRDFRRRTA